MEARPRAAAAGSSQRSRLFERRRVSVKRTRGWTAALSSLAASAAAGQSEQCFHRALELIEMTFQRWSHRIDPMRPAQVIFEIVARDYRVDAELDDVQTRVRRELHLAQHLLGVIRVLGKNEHEGSALLDGAGDFARVRSSRHHIARSDPTADPDALERRASGIGYRPVARGVRDENIVGHYLEFPCLREAARLFLCRHIFPVP
jgi:hypothetical protein